MAQDDARSLTYAKIVGESDNAGPILRCKHTAHKLVTAPSPNDDQNTPQNLYDAFRLGGLRSRPTAPCFGSRVQSDGTIGPFNWQSYEQIAKRIDAFANALHRHALVPPTPDGTRFLGMY